MTMTPHERDETLAQIRVDVADIKARIESLPDHERRLRSLERFRYSVPSTAVLGLVLAVASIVMHVS